MNQTDSATIPDVEMIRFGLFEMDLHRESLTRSGVRVKIQRQPFEVLKYLAMNANRLVSREEIYDHIWGGSFVEMDKGLNFCIHEIRQALGDSFRNSQFIQTAPRRGYRFVAPVSIMRADTEVPDEPSFSPSPRPRWKILSLFAGVGVTVGVVFMAVASAASPSGLETAREDEHAETTIEEAADAYREGVIYVSRSLLHADLEAAVGSFTRAVELDSNFAAAWARLSIARLTLYFEFGEADQLPLARDDLERAATLAPESPHTWLARGYLSYYGWRDFPSALGHLEKADRLRPNDPMILMALGFVLRRSGNWERAADMFIRASELAPQNFELMFALGSTLQQLRRYDEAERYHDRSIALVPEPYHSQRLKALLQIARDGDPNAALEVLQEWRAFRPELLLISPTLSRVLAEELAPQVERFDVVASGVDQFWFYLNTAAVFSHSGRLDRAQERYRLALQVAENRGWTELAPIGPDDLGSGRMALAYVFAKLGMHDEARDLAERVALRPVVESDAYSGPAVMVRYAEVLAEIGEVEKAFEVVEEVLSRPSWLSVATLRVDPIWAPLREHPRWEALVNGEDNPR